MHDIKRWKAVFLRESKIRTYLQAFYVSLIGSSENARLLIENEPGSIDRNAISGNELVRSCFAYSVFRYYERNDRTYLDIVLARFDRRGPNGSPDGLKHITKKPCSCIACEWRKR